VLLVVVQHCHGELDGDPAAISVERWDMQQLVVVLRAPGRNRVQVSLPVPLAESFRDDDVQ
jgi:hypothetical protein